MRPIPWLTAFALIGAGCGPIETRTPGERAQNAGRCSDEAPCPTSATCPPGESCSSQTPRGLRFAGALLADRSFDDSVKPVAVGGIERILPSPLLAFDPQNSDPATLSAQAQDSLLLVRGIQAGSALVRLLQPGTVLLYDRLEIEAKDVGSIALGPLGVAAEPNAWVGLVGSEFEVAVELSAPDGARLVDEGLEAASTSTNATARQVQWDHLSLRALTEGEHTLRIHLTDGSTTAVRFEAVREADAIAPTAWSETALATPLKSDQETSLCFTARAADRTVVGADWEFSVEGAIALHGPSNGCVGVVGNSPGAGLLHVRAAGHEASFGVTVVAR